MRGIAMLIGPALFAIVFARFNGAWLSLHARGAPWLCRSQRRAQPSSSKSRENYLLWNYSLEVLMQNRHMERSAAYAGIVGAILYVIAGVIPGVPPPATESAAQISGYVTAHSATLAIGAWLTLPAVAFILWFAIGFFDYLRDQNDADRTLSQWGVAGAVIWAALNVVAVSLMGAAAIHGPSAGPTYPVVYLFDIVMFVFGFGSFAAFAFAAANESRRRGAMPGWLNAFGYLVFVVDALFTLTIFGNNGTAFAMTGIGTIVTPLLSAVWVLVASIVLLVRVPKPART